MSALRLHTQHERSFETNRLVYPVLSRRSGGISVGVNLNPDKICNFDCIYCQVNRREEGETQFVQTAGLLQELGETLELVTSGGLYEHPKFASVPPALRRLNDIAFSGDGEPTTYKNFDEIIAACAALKRERGLAGVKMVLITNASMFHRPHVARGLEMLDANNGEIWAKLDAGTAEYFHRIERTKIPFTRILDNITAAARVRPMVIQSLFMRVHGEPPATDEITAYVGRLRDIAWQGGAIRHVQVYTVVRAPAERFVAPLADEELNTIRDRVIQEADMAATAYYGATP